MKFIITTTGKRWERPYEKILRDALKKLPKNVKNALKDNVIFVLITKDFMGQFNSFHAEKKGEFIGIAVINFTNMKKQDYEDTILHECAHFWNQNRDVRDTEKAADKLVEEWLK